MAQRRTKADPFADLTWDDLEEWAGSTIVSRGRGYQRGGHVQALARTPNGGLVAWVYGTHKYATKIEIENGELSALCSCPYGGTCKHAVAVVLVYLDHLKQQQEVPTAPASDRRLKLLDELDEEDEWDEEEEDEQDEEDQDEEDWEEDEEEEEPAARATPRRANKKATDSLSSFLAQQSKEQLVELLKEQARRHSSVRQALQDQGNLLSGSIKKLVKTARSEINKLGSGPDWDDDWRGERGGYGVSGNYERIQQHLEALLAAKHADEVVALGKDLLAAGVREVEMIHDEGETAEALSSCLEIVFRALPESSLAPAEQILWAIEAELNDEYDLCQGLENFWHEKHTAADWRLVADKLASRLKQYKSSREEDDNFSRNYRRDRLTDWLIRALEGSGRQEEIIPLCEREAEETGSYFRLIDRLKQAKRWKEAEEWIHKGIKATQQRLPGIADQLRAAWREIREREKNWPQVAALYAEQFFQQPGLHTFRELQKAAVRANVWPAVEAAARHYLETGELPQTAKRTKKGQTILPWPLPECEVKDTTERRKTEAPMLGVLIDIAIDEKQPDRVLHWYDQRKPTTAGSAYSWRYGWFDEDRIAQAVVDAYPDRAIAMWKEIAEAQIAQTQVRAYETAAGYLRKIQRVLGKLKREQEWKEYLAALRQANLRKPRCVEILDRLENRRILG
jgi:uncharacterized Zn finger protein